MTIDLADNVLVVVMRVISLVEVLCLARVASQMAAAGRSAGVARAAAEAARRDRRKGDV